MWCQLQGWVAQWVNSGLNGYNEWWYKNVSQGEFTFNLKWHRIERTSRSSNSWQGHFTPAEYHAFIIGKYKLYIPAVVVPEQLVEFFSRTQTQWHNLASCRPSGSFHSVCHMVDMIMSARMWLKWQWKKTEKSRPEWHLNSLRDQCSKGSNPVQDWIFELFFSCYSTSMQTVMSTLTQCYYSAVQYMTFTYFVCLVLWFVQLLSNIYLPYLPSFIDWFLYWFIYGYMYII